MPGVGRVRGESGQNNKWNIYLWTAHQFKHTHSSPSVSSIQTVRVQEHIPGRHKHRGCKEGPMRCEAWRDFWGPDWEAWRATFGPWASSSPPLCYRNWNSCLLNSHECWRILGFVLSREQGGCLWTLIFPVLFLSICILEQLPGSQHFSRAHF